MGSGSQRNQPCPCGSGRKQKRCCGESPAAAERGQRADPLLIVETDEGLLFRRVPAPSQLDEAVASQGKAAEEAVQGAAALWGMPDFVFHPEVEVRGSGSRELGDATLLLPDVGVIVQVKSRAASTDDSDKERRWMEKHASAAARQGKGTIRRLQSGPVRLTNERGRRLTVTGASRRWLTAVIVDHPRPPSGVNLELDGAVALLRRDWEFLFEQLKSTAAVVGYLERVLGEPSELGNEPARYFQLALADARADPEAMEPGLILPGSRTMSNPALPLEQAAAARHNGHRLVREIFEDVALGAITGGDEQERLRALAALDRLPVQYRGELGQYLLTALDEVGEVPLGETLWRLRSQRGPEGSPHLAFAACSMLTDGHEAAFQAWVMLKHHDLQQVTGELELFTVGVLLTPRHHGPRPFDTTLRAVMGNLQLSAGDLARYRHVWPSITDDGA